MLENISNNSSNIDSSTQTSVAPQQPVMEQLDERRMMSVAGGAIGINVNDGSTDFMNKAVPIMKQQGVTTVRIWHSTDFTTRSINGTLQRAIDYSNKGFDVMLIVQTKDGKATNPTTVKNWFKWAASNEALKNAVDRWEIGNEPDHEQYWKGTLKTYVNDFLKPAAEALRAAGEKVVSGAPSWNPQDVQEMIDYGMLDYVDYVGYHPYANGVKMVKQRVQEINAVVAGRKPIIASEWNVRGFESGSKADWAQAVKDAYPTINDGFAYNYYFALKKVTTPAGPAGILNADGTKNQLFFDAFATFKGGTPIVSTPAVKSPTVGNTPSSTTTPKPATTATATASTSSISGVLWNDSDADGKWDSGEGVTGVRVVYIDANGNGKLDKGERTTQSDKNGRYTFTGLKAGTYKIGRVFPKGYKLSNNALGYVTATIGAGQAIANINLGTRYAA